MILIFLSGTACGLFLALMIAFVDDLVFRFRQRKR